MRATSFLRTAFLGILLAGCGDSNGGGGFVPDDVDDAAVENDVVEDFGPTPTFDVPVDDPATPDVPQIDRPVGTDSSIVDRPVSTDRVTTDTPITETGVCPSSCRATEDCNPCRTPGDPGNYCCISGLCLYMTGACSAPAPDGGPTGDGGGDPGDGGGDGGGLGDGGLDDAGGAGDGGLDDAGGGAG